MICYGFDPGILVLLGGENAALSDAEIAAADRERLAAEPPGLLFGLVAAGIFTASAILLTGTMI